MNDLTIPKMLIKRVEKIATLSHRKPAAILNDAFKKGLDYEEWVMCEVDKGVAELDSGQVISHEELKHHLDKVRVERAKKRNKAA